MQNKRELNGSNESRCTEMSSNNGIKLRRRQRRQSRENKKHLHSGIDSNGCNNVNHREKRQQHNQFHGMLVFSSIRTRHTYNVIAGALFLFSFLLSLSLSIHFEHRPTVQPNQINALSSWEDFCSQFGGAAFFSCCCRRRRRRFAVISYQ